MSGTSPEENGAGVLGGCGAVLFIIDLNAPPSTALTSGSLSFSGTWDDHVRTYSAIAPDAASASSRARNVRKHRTSLPDRVGDSTVAETTCPCPGRGRSSFGSPSMIPTNARGHRRRRRRELLAGSRSTTSHTTVRAEIFLLLRLVFRRRDAAGGLALAVDPLPAVHVQELLDRRLANRHLLAPGAALAKSPVAAVVSVGQRRRRRVLERVPDGASPPSLYIA